MSDTRQQQRARERELLRLGQLAVDKGLPVLARRSALAGLAFLLTKTLTGDRRPERASAAAGLMHAAFEASLSAHPPSITLACGKGCAYCCHTWVGATAPEIFHAARAITASRRPELSAASITARAQPYADLPLDQRLLAKFPCALLVEGACSIYAARPTMCRQATSTSSDDCRDELDGREMDRDILVSKAHIDHARNARIALFAALEAADLPQHTYELTKGVIVALRTADAETRWLRGEDVFAGLEQGPPESRAVREAASVLAADIRRN